VEQQLFVWLASFLLVCVVNAIASPPAKAALLALAVAVLLPWVLLLFVGHPLKGVTLGTLAAGAVLSTLAVLLVRVAIQRRKRRET
jgi:hypothetical protein